MLQKNSSAAAQLVRAAAVIQELPETVSDVLLDSLPALPSGSSNSSKLGGSSANSDSFLADSMRPDKVYF